MSYPYQDTILDATVRPGLLLGVIGLVVDFLMAASYKRGTGPGFYALVLSFALALVLIGVGSLAKGGTLYSEGFGEVARYIVPPVASILSWVLGVPGGWGLVPGGAAFVAVTERGASDRSGVAAKLTSQ
jgi:hypothetical protein